MYPLFDCSRPSSGGEFLASSAAWVGVCTGAAVGTLCSFRAVAVAHGIPPLEDIVVYSALLPFYGAILGLAITFVMGLSVITCVGLLDLALVCSWSTGPSWWCALPACVILVCLFGAFCSIRRRVLAFEQPQTTSRAFVTICYAVVPLVGTWIFWRLALRQTPLD